MLEILAIFLPLAGFLAAFFFGRQLGHRGAELLTCTLMAVAALLSIWLLIDVALLGHSRTITLFSWISSGDLQVDWALRFDTLSAVMVFVVNVISALVHVYSIGYMHHDPQRAKFMSYLSLFTFMMLMLVTADNLVQMFFGWEGVGLASYLLIGFWTHKDSANAASLKAFVVNRIGDFGFALGIFATFVLFGSVSFEAIFADVESLKDATFSFLGMQAHALTVISLLLFVGAVGKSAQLGLHTWLPDAMEGPTPVSALIHAATMVTAGVFMMCRMSPVLEFAPSALELVAVLGALTAFVAATIGMTQFDIKRVIAYSTMSQLGYMFFAIGVSAYSAAMFHLMTHAFFKALLFLGAGSVIHAMSDEQDMRKMGGIWRQIPRTYVLMWIGSLSLAGIGVYGVYGLAGFYSKDIILEAAWAAESGVGAFAYWMGIAAAIMTAFYSWRLLFLTFHGRPRADEHVMAHVHESPRVMLYPLYVLAFGALFAGIIGYNAFVGGGKHKQETVGEQVVEAHSEAAEHAPSFWGESIFVLPENDSVAAAHHVDLWVKLAPVIAGLIGIALAWLFYVRHTDWPGRVASEAGPMNRLFSNKWYFDEIYQAVIVNPLRWLGKKLFTVGDTMIIDGFGPDGFAALARRLAVRIAALQTGYVYHYAFAMLIGVIILVGFHAFTAAG